MTHISHLVAAALIATGFAAQSPAQAGLPPLLPAAEAADASGAISLAMGPGVGISCTAFPPAAPQPDAAEADPSEAEVAVAANPRAVPKRNPCQAMPQAKL